MNYFYYPGCSLEGTAREYNLSTRSLMAALGAELMEIDGWACCGASAAHAESELLSWVLPARTLALAEKMGRERRENLDILVPCSACYLNLKKVSETARFDAGLLKKINTVLEEDGLIFENRLKVRHLLDVLTRDVDISDIEHRIHNRFTGFAMAPYYGCQCLRPYPVFDDPEKPVSMEKLIRLAGAAVHPWEMGGRCCGASHMTTHPETGRTLVSKILRAAREADAIVTVCPMCQMNLEGFQHKITKSGHDMPLVTILYLPQFLGMAMGLPEEDIRLDLNLSVTHDFRKKYQSLAAVLPSGARNSA